MIKKYLDKNYMSLLSLASLIFVLMTFFTFKEYCYTSIATDEPLCTIFNLPFYRMEFVQIIFSISLTIGLILGYSLKDKIHKFAPISTAILGIIIIFLAIFDVDMLQTLLPMNRISHIIMTISRVFSIVLGVSGIAIGLNVSMLTDNYQKINIKYIIISVIFTLLLSTITIAQNWFVQIYILIGLCIMLLAILLEYKKINKPNDNVSSIDNNQIIRIINNAFVIFIAILFFTVIRNYFLNTLKFNLISYNIIAGLTILSFIIGQRYKLNVYIKYTLLIITIIYLILLIYLQSEIFVTIGSILQGFTLGQLYSLHINNKKLSNIINSIMFIIATIISYIIVHKLGDVVKFSPNRIFYAINSDIFIIMMIFMIILLVVSIIKDRLLKVNKDKGISN